MMAVRSLQSPVRETTMTSLRLPLMTAAAALLLAGCSLAPDYERPAAPVPAALPQAGTTLAGVGPTAADAPVWADIPWQQFFTDPTLQGLIRQALDNNRSLRVAALNVEVARATYRVREADTLPEVNATAGETVQRTPRNASTTTPARDMITRRYSANLAVTSFELDLFGRSAALRMRHWKATSPPRKPAPPPRSR